MHGRTATPIAGKLGVLNLTVGTPADLLERNESLLVAKSAALTLRNAPRQDLSKSLTTESVPVAPASEVKIRLARTRPNNNEFFLFENARVRSQPGKNKAISRSLSAIKPKYRPERDPRRNRATPGGHILRWCPTVGRWPGLEPLFRSRSAMVRYSLRR